MSVINPQTITGCLLVVDDIEANIQVIGGILGRLGFEIIPASSGAQAFQRLAARRPDLILLDLLMPGLNGFEVSAQIRKNPSWADIPIIFLSSADDKEMIVRALECGGIDYITKPFHQAELIVRVRTHLALKLARDRLRQLAEDKDELLGILAHDLKSHLGGIHMSAQVLNGHSEAIAYPKVQIMAKNIIDSSGKMLTFVKEFLANSAAEYAVTLQVQPLLLSEAVSHAVENHQEAAQRKNLTLRAVLSGEDSCVQTDSLALNQVLDNLISNAVKFSPPAKQILVTVRSDASHIECQVQDQGPGFTAEDKAHMFRRYGRLSARPTAGEPSTGLGLSIVKKLMTAMRGDLSCESSFGHGATFIFRLPRAKPAT